MAFSHTPQVVVLTTPHVLNSSANMEKPGFAAPVRWKMRDSCVTHVFNCVQNPNWSSHVLGIRRRYFFFNYIIVKFHN